MTLETIQFPFGDRELLFSHPAEEAEMILSVLGGEDYPLAATRVGSDAPVIIDVGSNCGAAAVFQKTPSRRTDHLLRAFGFHL